MEIIRFSFTDRALFEEAYAIRKEVFLAEQNADPEMEYEHEEESHFYLIRIDGKAAATARWRTTSEGIKLERFAVRKNFRGQKLGEKILKLILTDIKNVNKPIYLHAQVQVVEFYAKYGFRKVGDQFEEARIMHYKMHWDPSI